MQKNYEVYLATLNSERVKYIGRQCVGVFNDKNIKKRIDQEITLFKKQHPRAKVLRKQCSAYTFKDGTYKRIYGGDIQNNFTVPKNQNPMSGNDLLGVPTRELKNV